jgi:nucleoside-diphosphate-sugar epimerase
MSKKKVLVTGGNGFIGSNLVRVLSERGYSVRVAYLDGTDISTVEGVCDETVCADIASPETLPAALEGVEIVFHLAAIASDWGSFELFNRVNHLGTANIIDAAIDAGVKRFVHTSSVAVHKYRDYFNGDEDAPRDATYPNYAITKILAEDAVRARADEIETVIVRPGTTPYGPGDVNNLAQVFDAIKKGIFGYVDGGRANFSVSYVDNLAEGYILAGESEKAVGGTFILSDNEPVNWKHFGNTVADLLGVKRPKLSLPYRLIFPPVAGVEALFRLVNAKNAPLLTRYRLNVTKFNLVFFNGRAREVLGFNPKVDFEEGIRRTVDWYLDWKKKQ